jgi:hypothetical protein
VEQLRVGELLEVSETGFGGGIEFILAVKVVT